MSDIIQGVFNIVKSGIIVLTKRAQKMFKAPRNPNNHKHNH